VGPGPRVLRHVARDALLAAGAIRERPLAPARGELLDRLAFVSRLLVRAPLLLARARRLADPLAPPPILLRTAPRYRRTMSDWRTPKVPLSRSRSDCFASSTRA